MPEPPDQKRLHTEYANRESRLAGSDIYSLFNIANLFIIQQRQREVLTLLRRHGFAALQNHKILEVGCGSGGVLLEYLSYGATPEHLHGADLLFNRVIEAHGRLPHILVTCADGQYLPYAEGVFDIVLQYTAFSSILDGAIKANLAHEILRVLRRRDGMILWYDFWLNPTNPHTRGIRPAEIRRLFPNCQFEFSRITLAPPIIRLLAPHSWLACYILERLRIFNTHYLVAIRPI